MASENVNAGQPCSQLIDWRNLQFFPWIDLLKRYNYFYDHSVVLRTLLASVVNRQDAVHVLITYGYGSLIWVCVYWCLELSLHIIWCDMINTYHNFYLILTHSARCHNGYDHTRLDSKCNPGSLQTTGHIVGKNRVHFHKEWCVHILVHSNIHTFIYTYIH